MAAAGKLKSDALKSIAMRDDPASTEMDRAPFDCAALLAAAARTANPCMTDRRDIILFGTTHRLSSLLHGNQKICAGRKTRDSIWKRGIGAGSARRRRS
jgi:hypothetical protein